MEREPKLRTDASGNTFLAIPSEEKVITATPFLPWRERSDYMEIPVHLAILLFIPACPLCESSISSGAFDDTSALTFNLQASTWARVLSTLTEAGIFNETLTDEHQLLSLMVAAAHDLPKEAMTITDQDISKGESFDSDDSQAARRQRAGAAQASLAEQAQPGPADLRFIHLASINHLTTPSNLPLSPLTRLVGAMGPCLTRRARMHEMASVRIIAAIIRQGINLYLGASQGAGFADPVLAASLCEFLTQVMLHPKMQSTGISEAMLRTAMTDAIQYVLHHSILPSAPHLCPTPRTSRSSMHAIPDVMRQHACNAWHHAACMQYTTSCASLHAMHDIMHQHACNA